MPFGEEIPVASGDVRAEVRDDIRPMPPVGVDGTGELGPPQPIDFGGSNPRTTALNYLSGPDGVRQKFTGYQKDEETALDFAEARMYDNRYGTFSAIDPDARSASPTNPQTWNRYIYAGQNPISRVDPHGTDWYFLNGEYRWSTNNKYFDRNVRNAVVDGELLYPTYVDGWTKVSLNESGEYRYSANGEYPGMSQEIILRNDGKWDYGESKIVDQAAFDGFLKQQQEVLDALTAVNEGMQMDHALRPLTDERPSINEAPQPPQLGYVYDNMRPDENGKPMIGESSSTLGARPRDIGYAPNGWALPVNGMSVSPTADAIPPFKQNSVFCLACNNLGNSLQVGMDKGVSNHLFLQPAKPMPVFDFQQELRRTQRFWLPVRRTPQD
jgi:RHS repeat-associated protein